jgi:hypothetical protein
MIGGIFSKDPDPSHLEHPFHRGGILYGQGLESFDLFGEALNFLLQGLELFKDLF